MWTTVGREKTRLFIIGSEELVKLVSVKAKSSLKLLETWVRLHTPTHTHAQKHGYTSTLNFMKTSPSQILQNDCIKDRTCWEKSGFAPNHHIWMLSCTLKEILLTTQSVWPWMHHSGAVVLPSSSVLPNSTQYCNIVQCKCRDTPASFFFRQDIWFNSDCSSFSTNDYISGKVPTDPLGLTDGKCIFCGSCGVVEGKKSAPVESFQKAWNQLDSPQLKLQPLVGEGPGRN